MMGSPNFSASFHFREGFPVSLRVCAPEVAGELLLGVASFVVPDEQAFGRADTPEAGDDGRVVSVAAVAVQFYEVFADEFYVVPEHRALGMARDADGVPWREVFINLD